VIVVFVTFGVRRGKKRTKLALMTHDEKRLIREKIFWMNIFGREISRNACTKDL